jgi:hypothetical protein
LSSRAARHPQRPARSRPVRSQSRRRLRRTRSRAPVSPRRARTTGHRRVLRRGHLPHHSDLPRPTGSQASRLDRDARARSTHRICARPAQVHHQAIRRARPPLDGRLGPPTHARETAAVSAATGVLAAHARIGRPVALYLGGGGIRCLPARRARMGLTKGGSPSEPAKWFLAWGSARPADPDTTAPRP